MKYFYDTSAGNTELEISASRSAHLLKAVKYQSFSFCLFLTPSEQEAASLSDLSSQSRFLQPSRGANNLLPRPEPPLIPIPYNKTLTSPNVPALQT